MKILVTGTAGQLGREVVAAFGGHDVVAADRSRLDVRDRHAVSDAASELRPEVIVHCAAWTDVDACESRSERAYGVNALGTRHVATAARLAGAHLVYVSTDYVFDGALPRPYHEWDRPNPLSVYGASKLAGEHELDAEATIVRTAWLFGRWGRNIVRTILELAHRDGDLRFVADQRGSPSNAADVADTIRRLALERLSGIHHVTNPGVATWFEVACEVLRCAGHDPARVHAVSSAALDPPRPAPRPANSALENAAIRLEGLPALPEWHDAVARVVAEILASDRAQPAW